MQLPNTGRFTEAQAQSLAVAYRRILAAKRQREEQTNEGKEKARD